MDKEALAYHRRVARETKAMSEEIVIEMQSRPPEFGLCYNCADGLHEECVGVPCSCECPGPAPRLSTEEVLRRMAHERDEARAIVQRWHDAWFYDDIKLLDSVADDTQELGWIEHRSDG